jgi:hypothetical protein
MQFAKNANPPAFLSGLLPIFLNYPCLCNSTVKSSFPDLYTRGTFVSNQNIKP